ncbi:solute carrier organic anion transporter family member 4C1-like [Glandiceps talaboti]
MGLLETSANGKPGNSSSITSAGKDSSGDESKPVNGYKAEDISPWGWFGFRPNCLQVFNTAPWLCATISAFMFVQGMVISGLVPTSLSSIEKRFELSSTSTGLIVAAYDVAVASVVLFVSYYGDYGNKPRLLSMGTLVLGFGCLTWTIPHFATSVYDYGNVPFDEGVCSTLNGTSECHDVEWSSLSHYTYVFILAMVLLGFGASPLYTAGTAFVDESVTAKQSGIYLGIIYFFSVLGPACGFLLGGAFLTIYTELPDADSVIMDPQHPAWVGAWWLGYVVAMIAIWFIFIPMSGFPKELPGVKQVQADRESESHHSDSQLISKKDGFGMSFKDFPAAFLMLCRNPTYLCLTASSCTEGLLIGGFTSFMPKFVENQFGVTAALAAALVGIAVVPGAAGGTLLGGWFIKKFNLNVQGMIKFSIIVALVGLFFCPQFLLYCPEVPIAGVYVPYEKHKEFSEVNLTNTCNLGCHCSVEVYTPMCGSNGLVYFDACHAGCTHYSAADKTYYDCKCIPEKNCTVGEEMHEFGCVTTGKCDNECWTLPLFLTLFFLSMLFNFQLTVPGTAATLRCVPEKQRAFAMGIQSVLMRTFGMIPGPIIVGAAIDSTCILWGESCGEVGACWVYDTFQFGLRFFVLSSVYMIATLVFLTLAMIVYKPPPMKGHDDEHEIEFSSMPLEDKMTSSSLTPSRENVGGAKLTGYTKYRNGTSLSNTNTSLTREDSRATLTDQEITASEKED